VGIDHDASRISQGTQAFRDLQNISFTQGSLSNLPADYPCDGIAMIDVMHYFDPETQAKLIQQAHRLLSPGGKLIIREVNPQGGVSSIWNRIYEKIATGIGFTRSEKKDLFFRTISGWTSLLEAGGFKVRSEPCTSFVFADILYICERT
jgi:ubiquinone/menaquinone biosynthesis C-methylase UbiE